MPRSGRWLDRLERVAPGPVLLIASVVMVGLLLVSGAYGFHRDELYFIVAGRHPAFGYVDQPPFTPLISAAMVQLLGLTPTSIRILPALVAGACIVLAAAIASELGGSRRAQVIAAVTSAFSALLAAGHLDSTETYDILAWTVVLWLVVRLLRGADRRLWLAVGLVAGIDLENKDLILFLGVAIAVGLILARRWDVIRSPWAWTGLALAVALWLPNLAWQAANGFPQLEMSRAIAADSGDENRLLLLPMQLLLGGLLLSPVLVGGVAWLLRAVAARPWRTLGWAYLVLLLALFATGGKGYYAAGYFVLLFAAGSIVTDRWLDRGRRRLRAGSFAAAAIASGVFGATVLLPIVPPSSDLARSIRGLYKESAEQVGWPEMAAEVEAVAATFPTGERSVAIVLTGNYGEAGALTLLGGSAMPPVYSGHNSFWDWGPPPEVDGPVIAVGYGQRALDSMFERCSQAGVVDNRVGLANDEQGGPIWICRGRIAPWASLWDSQRHLD